MNDFDELVDIVDAMLDALMVEPIVTLETKRVLQTTAARARRLRQKHLGWQEENHG